MCREAVDEEDLLARFRMNADDGVLRVGVALLQLEALLDRESRTERRFDAVSCTQPDDLFFHTLG